jgi:hypothetical protein
VRNEEVLHRDMEEKSRVRRRKGKERKGKKS